MQLPELLLMLAQSTAFSSRLLTLYSLTKPDSFLEKHGWFSTTVKKMPTDARGRPIPWITYPALAFLEARVQPSFNVFEFGSGNSTLWWSQRVRNVVSCEHDKTWHERMARQMPGNVRYIYRELNASYATTHTALEEKFDILVIDGRRRVDCVLNALPSLASDGIIIFDNSERCRYSDAFLFLQQQRFRRIDFWGFGPVNLYEWCTSVFYRTKNCLGI